MIPSPSTDARFSGLVNQALAQTPKATTGTNATARTRAQAAEFETVFLSTMFQSMFTGIEGDGPMGSSAGVAPWRSFLTQEYAKSCVQKGGIGLADHVYRELMAKQEVRANSRLTGKE